MRKKIQVLLAVLILVTGISISFAANTVKLDPPWDRVKELSLTRGKIDAPSGCYAYTIQSQGIVVMFTFCPSDGSAGIFQRDSRVAMGIGVGMIMGKRQFVLVDLLSNIPTVIDDALANQMAFDIFRELVRRGLL